MSSTAAAAGVRLDVWLWAARFYKTRSLSKEAVTGGRIQIDGQAVGKASRLVRVGDRVRVERAGEVWELEVLALSEQRGPASVAQTLYVEDADSIARRLAAREARRLQNAGFSPPEHRPDKRARRKLDALRKQDDGLPPWFPR